MAVAITTDLGGITNFDIHGDPTTVGARWKKWKRSFELFVVGKGVQDAAQKKALLLHCGGPQMQDVYYTFPEVREPGEGETVYTVAMEQLDQYFMPQVNIPYERHLFRTMAQLPTESVDQFITRLRERAEYCEFGDTKDENIRDQVIENVCPVVCEGNFWRKEEDSPYSSYKILQDLWKLATGKQELLRTQTTRED